MVPHFDNLQKATGPQGRGGATLHHYPGHVSRMSHSVQRTISSIYPRSRMDAIP
jgi:hypothetical protein